MERCWSSNKMTTGTEENSFKGKKKAKSIITNRLSKRFRSWRDVDDDVFPRRSCYDLNQIDSERPYMEKRSFLDASPIIRKSFSGRHSSTPINGLNPNGPKRQVPEGQEFRIFVGTWNVGGKSPNNGLNLEDFLQVEGSADIYVLGFQETVPLNAGNILVVEDNEPAAKWIGLIGQALNKPRDQLFNDIDSSDSSNSKQNYQQSKNSKGLLFFQKPSLKVLSKTYRVSSALVKPCNCSTYSFGEQQRARALRELVDESDSEDDSPGHSANMDPNLNYYLISSKQMVGIFLSVWVRNDLVQHVGHVRVASLGRGIMGCLGNKGCIAMSMTLYRTTFCFVCSHLASGEKEGDEIKRNFDVAEIQKNIQFPRVCKPPNHQIPEKIMDHDRVIWFGDLNYRVALSYAETKVLLEENDWDALLEKDQLKLEQEAGRVFKGWKEGKIYFAPTYKYTQNSDSYAGETVKSKRKRRTPAWCDRILWYGDGIEQLHYLRGESRFSDHRPVCAVFVASAEMGGNNRLYRKGYSAVVGSRIPYEEAISIPQRHSFYEF